MQRSPRAIALALVAGLLIAMPVAAQSDADEEPMASLKLTFTNQGRPLYPEERGKFYIYEVDERKTYVAWGHSDRVAEFPEGTYDLVIRYENGEVEETITRTEVEFTGDAEEEIDFNVPVAELKVDITRGGLTVEPFTGSYAVYPAGRRDRAIVRKRPGTEIKIRPGTYDIEVAHRGPEGMKTQWVEGVLVDGSAHESVELGLTQDQLAHVTLTMVQEGRRVPAGEGIWRVYDIGRRATPLAERRSGEMLGLEKGTYDIGAFLERNGETLEKWLVGVELDGDVEREVEMGVAMAKLRVNITDGGRPLPRAWFSVYEVGQRDSPLVTGQSGDEIQLEPGSYDIGCFLREGGLRADQWLRRRPVRDSQTLEVELTHEDAFLTVYPRSGWWRRGDNDATPRLLILMDSSSRMRARTEDGTRLEVALRAVADGLAARPGELQVGLRTIGGDAGSRRECRTSSLAAAPATGNEAELSQALAGLTAGGAAPIGHALEQAVADMPPGPGNTLVLVTAGADGCGGDLCSAASKLLRDGIVGRIFVVGFDLDRDQLRRLDCVGEQFAARTGRDLTASLREIVRETTEDSDGTFAVFSPGRPAVWIAGGTLGDKVRLNEGTYDIQIRSRGRTYTWDGVTVSGDYEATAGRRPKRR